ncbi:DNA-directed RNA polymerase subunit H RpoH-RPB5 [Ecytonucleospora hepatopenaei]|uniref:DNA-directed RNA polymerases I, II, and III subunit RPABC1 n=1 Tax=Ecytonucleospora hepatopenaei TaxID=646526 RepID=A0A1W0E315_9MICR|nr:DNA-directed RNA polymerase subunit H RpoH-RPB5 [Ecytonucleospora hepatopenaei]
MTDLENTKEITSVSQREIFLARNTIIEMLKDRGYSTNQETFENLDEFMVFYNGNKKLNFTCGTSDGTLNNKFISVVFTTEIKINKKSVELIMSEHLQKGISNLIIVCVNKLNHASISYISNINNSNINNTNNNLNVEIFLYKELLFNPTKHILVPKQTIIDEEEKQQFLLRYKCKLDDLPVMLKTDIIARYLGGQINDVVKIIRKSKTAGESEYYRVIR